MTLRERVLLAQLPLIVALGTTAIVAAASTPALGRNSAVILKDNYRSVVAVHAMKEALSEIERGALRRANGTALRDTEATALGTTEIDRGTAAFEEALRAEEGNPTERGETEATNELRASWRHCLSRLEQAESGAQEGPFNAPAMIALTEVKTAVQRILTINQEAMSRKSALASRAAERLGAFLVLASVLACLTGVTASFVLTSRLLRPLSVLSSAARRLGQGDLQARARVDRADEIGALAREFNTMADRLVQFRNSSLGELLEVERQTQAAIDSLPDPVLILDLRGGLLAANRAAQSLLHVEVAAHAGEEGPLAHCPPLVREAVERERAAVVSGQPGRASPGLEDAVRLPTAEGEIFLLPRANRVLSEGGELRGVTITVQDVTRARRLDELKNDLVATVAHEFRTPLTSLRMAVHLCLERAAGPVTEKQLDLLHAARQDTERLQQLVDDLLDLSRLQSGQVVLHPSSLVVEDLVEAALAACQPSAREKAIALKTEVLPGTGTVWADPERLGLVLGNLIGNAVKHSPGRSPVVVRAWRVGPTVRLEVIDRGPGIAPEYRALVFAKFFRVPGAASNGGAGLGLFLAKEITQAHGGRIGVDSGADGVGSVFWLEWPAEAPT